jgi:hypothetical protein
MAKREKRKSFKRKSAKKETIDRPTGVTVICALGSIGAGIGIFASLGLLSLILVPDGFLLGIVGVIGLAISLTQLYGIKLLYKMLKKGWKITIGLFFVVVLFDAIVNIALLQAFPNFISLIVNMIIVGYLWTKKDLFV